jgi:hypothetical protein
MCDYYDARPPAITVLRAMLQLLVPLLRTAYCDAAGAATTYCGDYYCVLLQRTAYCCYRYIYNALLAAATGTSTTYCLLLLQVHLQRTAYCCYRYIYNVLLAAATGTSTTHYLLLLRAHLQRTACCYNYFHNALRVLQLQFFQRGAAPGGCARQRVVSAGLLHGDLSLGLGRFQRPDVLPTTSGEQGQGLLSQPVGAALPGTAAYHCEPL